MSRPVAVLLQAARTDLLANRTTLPDLVFSAGHRIIADVQAGRLPRAADFEVIAAHINKTSHGANELERDAAWTEMQKVIRNAMREAGL